MPSDLIKYGFKSSDVENFSDADCIYFVKRATINNCDVRAVDTYNVRKGKFIKRTFHLDIVNGKALTEVSREKQRTWLNTLLKLDEFQFARGNFEEVDTPEALAKFMEDLDAITAFLSAVINLDY